MQVRDEQRDGQTIVTVSGRIDVVTSPGLQRELDARLGEATHVVLDLAGVDYISSAGLRVLLSLAKRLKAGGGTLVLCRLTPPVADVLEVSGLMGVFTVQAE